MRIGKLGAHPGSQLTKADDIPHHAEKARGQHVAPLREDGVQAMAAPFQRAAVHGQGKRHI